MPIKLGTQGLILPPSIVAAYVGSQKVYTRPSSGGLSSDASLLMHLATDGSGNAIDVTGNVTDLAHWSGGTTEMDSDFSEYVYAAGDYSFTTPLAVPSEYTWAMWLKPENVDNVNRIFWAQSDTGDYWHWSNLQQDLEITCHNEPFGDRFLFEDFFVNGSGWVHVANTWNGATSAHDVYVDGVLFHSATSGSNVSGAYGTVAFGGSGGGNWFMGRKHNARLYDRKLTAAEILEIYNHENPL